MSAKDFAPIENDYSFFMAHSTEAESDVVEHVKNLSGFCDGRSLIRWLDFGCGTGEFTERLLTSLNWPAEAVELTLVEPVQHQREAAVKRLSKFSNQVIEHFPSLPTEDSRFDLIISNHSMYYVDHLEQTLLKMISLLNPGGRLAIAIADGENPLLELWQVGFSLLGQPVPYHAAEDVESILTQQGTQIQKSRAYYQLAFPDTVGNRL